MGRTAAVSDVPSGFADELLALGTALPDNARATGSETVAAAGMCPLGLTAGPALGKGRDIGCCHSQCTALRH